MTGCSRSRPCPPPAFRHQPRGRACAQTQPGGIRPLGELVKLSPAWSIRTASQHRQVDDRLLLGVGWLASWASSSRHRSRAVQQPRAAHGSPVRGRRPRGRRRSPGARSCRGQGLLHQIASWRAVYDRTSPPGWPDASTLASCRDSPQAGTWRYEVVRHDRAGTLREGRIRVSMASQPSPNPSLLPPGPLIGSRTSMP